jgi:hypothetical protein
LLKSFIGVGSVIFIFLYAFDLWRSELGAYGLQIFAITLALLVLPLAYWSSAFFSLVVLNNRAERLRLYVTDHPYRKSEYITPVFVFAVIVILFLATTSVWFFNPVGTTTSYSNQGLGFSFAYATYNGVTWQLLNQTEVNASSTKAIDKTVLSGFQVGLQQGDGPYAHLVVVSVTEVPNANVTAQFLQARLGEEVRKVVQDPTLEEVSHRTILVNGAPGYEHKYQTNTSSFGLAGNSPRAYTLSVLYGNQHEYRIASDTDLLEAKNFDQILFEPVIVQSFAIFNSTSITTT